MKSLILSIAAIFFLGCTQMSTNDLSDTKVPSITKKYHGITHVDEYEWLRVEPELQKDNAQLQKFLTSEQNKVDTFYHEHQKTIKTIRKELLDRVNANKLDEEWEDSSFLYVSKYINNNDHRTVFAEDKVTGKRYRLFGPTDIKISGDGFSFGKFTISPDKKLVGWVENSNGDNNAVIRFRNLITGSILKEEVKNVGSYANVIWSHDSSSVFYVQLDEQNRPYVVKRHFINSELESDSIIYAEANPELYVTLAMTHSNNYLVLDSSNPILTQIRLLDINRPNSQLMDVLGENDLGYIQFQHVGNKAYIQSNHEYSNGQLYYIDNFNPSLPIDVTSLKSVIKRDTSFQINQSIFLDTFIIVHERKNGIDRLVAINTDNNTSTVISFPDKEYGIGISDKQSVKAGKVNFYYESLLTPQVRYELNTSWLQLERKSQREVKGFLRDNYIAKRISIPAHDDASIPVSIVYHKDYPPTQETPLYLYVYGAYGEGIPPEFPLYEMSLINRGFTFAIAHVRGGNERGGDWHKSATHLNKKNTFYDLISVSKFFIDNKMTSEGNITLSGASAGGMAIGYAINNYPNLFNSAVALVPFVDVLSTLLDDSLEYTIQDWGEFGNPLESKEIFEYQLSYSPVDNVKRQSYPNLYATAGMSDSAVGYWEPAKWVSKINSLKTNTSTILLDVKGGGHINSEKYSYLEDMTKIITFVVEMEKCSGQVQPDTFLKECSNSLGD
ncbi:prolyl oligopeptidase family serine peptidase [Psychrobium sp. nBUS_13]|uniref:prolyl oligopeptidase family serine peptidase n=1 Tax=Psychrobium sp. nBUS_13 TaxID=3395319 RepID=UPI003EBED504